MKKRHTYIKTGNIRNLLIMLVVMAISTTESFAQLNALDYRLQKRPALEKFDNPQFKDHTFMSIAAGAQFNFLNGEHGTEVGPSIRYYFGKWFTPVIGARFGVDMSYLYDGGTETYGLFGFNLDYLANISAFARGYNPDRLFEFYGIAGVTYKRSFRYGYGSNMYGAVLGFQGNFTLSSLIDLYVEPKVTLTNDSYNDSRKKLDRRFDLLPEVTVGVTYNMVPDEKRKTTEFTNTRFRDNIFFTSAFGVQRITSRLMDLKGRNYAGFSGMLGFGGWFNQVQGVRLSAVAGFSPFTPDYEVSSTTKLIDGVGRIDYLVNYSNLFGGYNERRIFKLIGTFGVELAATRYEDTSWKLAGGLGIGLQGAFRVSPTVDLFMEPRMSFYNKTYTHGVNNRFDGVASMLFGVTYHSSDKEYQKDNDPFEHKSKSDNMFVTASAGIGANYSRFDQELSAADMLSYRFNIGFGKWFTKNSGLQISGGTILFGTRTPYSPTHEPYRARTLTLSADYLLNMTNVVSGYREDRLFELIGGAGISAIYHHTSFYPALQAFFRGNFNLTNNWSLYIEPHAVWTPTRGVFTNTISTRKSIIMTANIGTSYRLKGYEAASYDEFAATEGKRLFFSVGLGASGNLDNRLFNDAKFRVGPLGRLSVGCWESPILGWRVSAMAEKLNGEENAKDISHAGFEADVMFSITNAALGYKPYRLFDLNLNAGVHAGLSIVNHNKRFIPGFKGSVQGLFNITPKIGLYVEPQIAVYLNKFDGTHKQKTNLALLAGLTYTMNKADRTSSVITDMDNKNFISMYGGLGFYGNTLMSKFTGKFADKMTYSGGLAYGRWITPVHGLRLNAEYNHIQKPYEIIGEKMGVVAARADYMLNMTSLIAGYDLQSKFDAILFAGVGAAVPVIGENINAKTTYTAAIGLKANIRITDHINFYVEPRGVFYGDKIDGYKSNAGFDATGMVLAGFDFKF
ncbi:MAG: hypothetical protein IKU59_03640 [Bacteroidales bacterium]|nr:hypothetical protein [Bacteroidales bacterium]